MASTSPASTNSNSTSSGYKFQLDVSKFVPDNLSATANNYDQWKQQMLDLINKASLFDFIDQTKKAPSKTVAVEEKEVENQDYISWKRSDDLLQLWIRTKLTEEISEEVKHFKIAGELWTYLEKLFSSKLPKPNITATAMASSSSSSINSSVVSDFVKKTLSVSEKNYSEWRKQMYEFIKSQGFVGHIDGTDEPTWLTFWPGKRRDEATLVNFLSRRRRDIQVRELIRIKLADDILQEMAVIMPDRTAKAKGMWVDRTAKAMWVALDKIFGHYVGLYKATIKGDWEKAEEFIKQEPDNIAMRAAIRDNSETVLIVAVKQKERNNFVEKLLNQMSPEDLAQGDRDNRTALHRAAAVDNIDAAKLLVYKNRYLPNAQTVHKRIPLYFAATHRKRKMVIYLLRVTEDEATSKNIHLPQFWSHSPSNANHSSPSYQKPHGWNPTPFKGEPGFRILHQLILSEFYDIALALVRDKPELAFFIPSKKEHLEYLSLMAISQKPSSFQSGFSSNFFKQLIYSCYGSRRRPGGGGFRQWVFPGSGCCSRGVFLSAVGVSGSDWCSRQWVLQQGCFLSVYSAVDGVPGGGYGVSSAEACLEVAWTATSSGWLKCRGIVSCSRGVLGQVTQQRRVGSCSCRGVV
ncbi:unnamed protein product [Camellia sinensis]